MTTGSVTYFLIHLFEWTGNLISKSWPTLRCGRVDSCTPQSGSTAAINVTELYTVVLFGGEWVSWLGCHDCLLQYVTYG